ncbi:MAG: hypothetical protein Kow0090_00240 [Myxococcota bacterium]
MKFGLNIKRGASLRKLDPNLHWAGQNREILDEFIVERGRFGKRYDPDNPPKAVFDCDNTVILNDVGDAMVFWMLENEKILQPPKGNWRMTNKFLKESAVEKLNGLSRGADEGEPLPTASDLRLAKEILSIYYTGKTSDGEEAFSSYNPQIMNPSYALGAQLEAGYTPDEIRGFARSAAEEYLKAPLNAEKTIGGMRGLPGCLRIYRQMQDLIGTLLENGFEVWMLSASPQFVVEVYAEMVGIRPERVIGIRGVIGDDGRLTCDLQGGGVYKDGESELVTFKDGKRFWMNREIFGVLPERAMERTIDITKRPVFGAADSDTDISFMLDVTGLRLVIKRKESGLSRLAEENGDGRWLTNPAFAEDGVEG